jgi:predicted molibdopterin-dependent oxidoreductase YjgC
MEKVPARKAQFVRKAALAGREQIAFRIDGSEAQSLAGDTVLTAILLRQRAVRKFEFSSTYRSGFCLIGACQDCWVRLADGRSVQACTTLLEAGMDICVGAADER